MGENWTDALTEDKGLGLKSWLTGTAQRDLKKIVSDEPASLDQHRVAVLPFANMSPDPQDEFFADGLTEELITELSKIPGLRVIARTSVMLYKKAPKPIQEIGRELRVGSLLEGSVRKAGNRIRITAQLIDTGNEEHLWTDRFDREIGDIFAVQGEIAENVAHSLQLRLLPSTGPQNQPTESIDAYTLYLKGRSLWNKRSETHVREALGVFEKIVSKYPKYARAYSGIADCYLILVPISAVSWAEAGPKSRAASEKALELNDRLAEAHASLGHELEFEMNREEAEREYRKAIELNPSYATAHQWYSIMLENVGRWSEGVRETARAEEADPLSPVMLLNSGWVSWVNGNEDEALVKWNRGLEVDPGFDMVHGIKAAYYIWKSLKKEALAELSEIEGTGESSNEAKAWVGALYGLLGEKDKAAAHLQNLLNEAKRSRIPAGFLCILYAGLGDTDRFYEWATKAVEDRSLSVGWLRYDPLLTRMRDDPRYYEILRRYRVEA